MTLSKKIADAFADAHRRGDAQVAQDRASAERAAETPLPINRTPAPDRATRSTGSK